MTQSTKELYGEKLGALDGEIGHVKDFYFDDQSWVVRYLVADTGNWLPGREVLLSPHALGGILHEGKALLVNLMRKTIKESPSIESHKPVSRQYEEEYHRYYGWPFYWQGDGLWGMSGFPILESAGKPFAGERATAVDRKHENPDAHLRSMQAVTGYNVLAGDGIAGHVVDFLIDDKNWAVRELVIKTGHRFTGNKVLLPVGKITGISYEDSTVFVNLTKDEVEKSPEQHPSVPLVMASPRLD
ncbi:MAG: PRC-barrel domain-containing protein [Limisphaerales bacterium]